MDDQDDADRARIDHLAQRALRAAGDHAGADRIEHALHGTGSVVVLSPDTAVRIARDRHRGPELLRSQRLVDALPELPFAVPTSRAEPVEDDGWVAVPTRRLHGRPHPAGDGDPGPLRELLEAIHTIPFTADHPDLATPRTFMGGEAWEHVLRDRVVPLLPAALREEALVRIDALRDLPAVTTTVNHGDLAGENILWQDGRVSAVLDWDLTAHEDPAEDTASLAWWHGWDIMGDLVDPATAIRALAFQGSIPLQMIAFQVLAGRPREDINATIQRVRPMLAPHGRGPHR